MSYAEFSLFGDSLLHRRLTKFFRSGFPLKATIATIFSAGIGLIVTAIKDTPEFIWVPGILAMMLIWIDGCTGLAAAAWENRFRSKGVWLGGSIKLFVYFTLGIPAWAGAWLTATRLHLPLAWTVPLAWCSWVYVAELASIRENLKALQKTNKEGRVVRLGPVNKFLDKWDDALVTMARLFTKQADPTPDKLPAD